MWILLLYIFKHCGANYDYGHYAVAPIRKILNQIEVTHVATLPPLIEMPQLREGSQSPYKMSQPQDVDVKNVVESKSQACPACPVPTPPAICKQEECPELICDVVKVDSGEAREARQHRTLIKEEEKMRVRYARRQRRQTSVSSIVELNNKCNDNQLGQIMMDSISTNIVAAKVTIAERASHEIGGQFDVVCTMGIFSYYVAARMFCEMAKDSVTCFAFRHDDLNLSFPQVPAEDKPLERQAGEEFLDRIGETGVRPLEEPPKAADFDEKDELDFLGASRWLATRTTSTPQPQEFGLDDAQTHNLREETFDGRLEELKIRKR